MRADHTQNDMTIDGFKVSTWFSEGAEPPYQAVVMCIAAERLADYELSEEEKTSIPALMAGYCRLVDDHGWVGYGETEFDAIQDLFSNATRAD